MRLGKGSALYWEHEDLIACYGNAADNPKLIKVSPIIKQRLDICKKKLADGYGLFISFNAVIGFLLDNQKRVAELEQQLMDVKAIIGPVENHE